MRTSGTSVADVCGKQWHQRTSANDLYGRREAGLWVAIARQVRHALANKAMRFGDAGSGADAV